jgi:hypothetical protein
MQAGSSSFSSAATHYGRLPVDSYFALSGQDVHNGPFTITGDLTVDGTSDLVGPVTCETSLQTPELLLGSAPQAKLTSDLPGEVVFQKVTSAAGVGDGAIKALSAFLGGSSAADDVSGTLPYALRTGTGKVSPFVYGSFNGSYLLSRSATPGTDANKMSVDIAGFRFQFGMVSALAVSSDPQFITGLQPVKDISNSNVAFTPFFYQSYTSCLRLGNINSAAAAPDAVVPDRFTSVGYIVTPTAPPGPPARYIPLYYMVIGFVPTP